MRPQETNEFRGVLNWGVIGAVVLTLSLVWVLGVEAFGLAVWAPWRANMVTEITRNTNQYVTTQQVAISGLVRQYDELENYPQTEEIDRQQRNLVLQMCDKAMLIDDEYVPEQAQPLMRQEGCWE